MDPIGNSPVIISKKDLTAIAPTWMNMSLAIKKDPEADKAWRWVLEMYGYSLSSHLHNVHYKLVPKMQAQPPWDTKIRDFVMIHFTYGMDYTLDGKFTPGKIGQWRFDKRSYMGSFPPKQLAPPPKNVPELVQKLIEMINGKLN